MELLISATVPNFDAPITIPRYDYKICSAFTSVKSTSGDLIKNLCYVNQGKNFADAQNFCSTNQMKLAIMGDSTVQSAILSAFKSNPMGVFGVLLGQWNCCGWVVLGRHKRRSTDGERLHNCTKALRQRSPFLLRILNCCEMYSIKL
jgi:hypothetical protein